MKSAFDLAMEKFGDEPIKKLTDDQKKAIAEINSRYEAKIAEARLAAQDKQQKACGEISIIDQINQDMIVEIASLREKSEIKKETIRNDGE